MTLIKSSQSSTISPSAIVEPVQSRISPWVGGWVYPVSHFILLPFYLGNIKITGQENLPKGGPVLLAPTHRSRWDSFVLASIAGRYVTGRDLRYMTTKNEVTGLQGWFIRRLGGFPIDLKRPEISSLRHSIELLLDGQMLVIFPEGGIFEEVRVQPLKSGLARLALQAESMKPDLGIKIVPISIHYGQLLPTWRCGVKVDIGSPIKVSNYSIKSPKQSALKLTEDLEIALKNLHEN